MIDKSCLTKEWLENSILKYKKLNNSIDIQLLEKTVNALYLLECLIKMDIKFIFKGGTSLVLLLNKIKRFSIDIDIIIENKLENIENILSKLIEYSNFFTRYEENLRPGSASDRINLKHYKFFYISLLDNFEKYVLLDIAYEKNLYPKIIKKEINCFLIKTSQNVCDVSVPSIESILGDKLTVLAPNTTRNKL
ncbi:MAG: nucleotidyl transferase AbiEii/AbiGii toxin family protein [Clostridia bacterium]|nr:nucleotidyl transferase AbiEii/AbiGii toxin family protein [Clostridia bacterium]MDD4386486.1 nucleotidyl transferase AbiEii/AbiGii toxin family protein [Clostridia bacterium]